VKEHTRMSVTRSANMLDRKCLGAPAVANGTSQCVSDGPLYRVFLNRSLCSPFILTLYLKYCLPFHNILIRNVLIGEIITIPGSVFQLHTRNCRLFHRLCACILNWQCVQTCVLSASSTNSHRNPKYKLLLLSS
jgi:hypothetical protein